MDVFLVNKFVENRNINFTLLTVEKHNIRRFLISVFIILRPSSLESLISFIVCFIKDFQINKWKFNDLHMFQFSTILIDAQLLWAIWLEVLIEKSMELHWKNWLIFRM